MPARDPSLPPPPQIDLDKLDYPSDAITIKHLRVLFPGEFRRAGFHRKHFLDPSDHGEEFQTMLNLEREIAETAFCKALGQKPPRTHSTHQERWEWLEEYYTTDFKIAQGPQHARQMIRDLEQAATEQALQHVPGRRP